jgi:hypothetical protein
MTASDDKNELDFNWLLKLRVAVARCGEMDLCRWWYSGKQLAPAGASVLKRGFPRTHHFAQARSVMTIASHRCDQLLAQDDVLTLWRLPAELEDRFEANWDECIDRHTDWRPFFEAVAAMRDGNVVMAATELGLVTRDEVKTFRALKAPEGRPLSVGRSFTGPDGRWEAV